MNRQYLDPIFIGKYPAELPRLWGEAWPRFPSGDLEDIQQPLDFVGINYYKRGVPKADAKCPCERASRAAPRTRSTPRWIGRSFPEGLTDILLWFRDRYGRRRSTSPRTAPASTIRPRRRRRDQRSAARPLPAHHLSAVARSDEAPAWTLRGYFVWSLLDNLEWSHGYEAASASSTSISRRRSGRRRRRSDSSPTPSAAAGDLPDDTPRTVMGSYRLIRGFDLGA